MVQPLSIYSWQVAHQYNRPFKGAAVERTATTVCSPSFAPSEWVIRRVWLPLRPRGALASVHVDAPSTAPFTAINMNRHSLPTHHWPLIGHDLFLLLWMHLFSPQLTATDNFLKHRQRGRDWAKGNVSLTPPTKKSRVSCERQKYTQAQFFCTGDH